MESTESQCRELDSCFLKCYMHIFDGVQQDIKLNKVYQINKNLFPPFSFLFLHKVIYFAFWQFLGEQVHLITDTKYIPVLSLVWEKLDR